MSSNKIQEKKLYPEDYIFIFGVILMVGTMATSLSAHVLNILLLLNLVMAACFLAISFVEKTIFAWPSFPSLLLLATLFRLTVNVSVSRLVLRGQDSIFELIGSWSVLPSVAALASCFVAIAALVLLQFFYIKKITMSIAEGMKTNENCLKTDSAIIFYGKMAGSIKFIHNEAIANLALMIINCFGGFYIAVFQKSAIPSSALNHSLWFTILAAACYQIPTTMSLIATHKARECQA